MTSLVVIGHLTTAGGEARQKVIDAITQVSQFSREQEPGVTRYAVTIPRDPLDQKSIYVIEEYADQAALDSHMGSAAVSDLIKHFSSDASLFGGATNVSNLETAFSFSRPEIPKANDPYIVFATLEYKEGTRAGAVDGWQRVTLESQKNEPGTLGYAILKDKDHQNTIRTVEVYEGEKYLWDVHAKSAAVTKNKVEYGDIRTNVNFVFLKVVAGFLHKDKQTPNL